MLKRDKMKRTSEAEIRLLDILRAYDISPLKVIANLKALIKIIETENENPD